MPFTANKLDQSFGGTVKALWDSIVRTFTPIIVGAVVGFAVANGIELDPQFELALIGVITVGAQGIYYGAVRLLETYVSPKFGWLLGLAKAPDYTENIPVSIQGVSALMTRGQYRDYLQSIVDAADEANSDR